MSDPTSVPIIDYINHLFIEAKEYSNHLFLEGKSYVDQHNISSQVAVDKAEHAMNVRLEAMNEFRSQLNTQASRFVTRDEVDRIVTSIESDIRFLRESRAEIAGKANQSSVMIATTIAIIGAIIAIFEFASKFFH